MRNQLWRDRIGLRIDVDFACDLRSGVPYMLDFLRDFAMKATFFVAIGGHTGPRRPWLGRLLKADYWRRYRRLGLWRILTRMGPPSILAAGDRLRRSASILHRIVEEGHELGLHGYDHAWWADHVWTAERAELEAEIDRACDALRDATSLETRAWASPNWRTNEHVIEILHSHGAPYLSECWGRDPFVTVTGTCREVALPHLPITLPSLESLRMNYDISVTRAVEAALENRPRDRFDVMCMHGYYEGLLEREAFPLFLSQCRKQDLETITLARMARDIGEADVVLPRCRLKRDVLPGFVGDVSRQGEPCKRP